MVDLIWRQLLDKIEPSTDQSDDKQAMVQKQALGLLSTRVDSSVVWLGLTPLDYSR